MIVSSRKQADLNRHLARRLASEQITVNAIAPGPFESKMTAFMLETLETHGLIEQTVPLGRIGRPDDAAGLMIFLASRAGSYLTGAAAFAAAVVVIAFQVPTSLRPSPLASPGAWSCANVYSGIPL